MKYVIMNIVICVVISVVAFFLMNTLEKKKNIYMKFVPIGCAVFSICFSAFYLHIFYRIGNSKMAIIGADDIVFIISNVLIFICPVIFSIIVYKRKKRSTRVANELNKMKIKEL